MRKLLTRLQAYWTLLWGYAHGLPVLAMTLHKQAKLVDECIRLRETAMEKAKEAYDAIKERDAAVKLSCESWNETLAAKKERDQYERELRLMQMEPNRAEQQLMQLRVHGMSRNGVIGYGVTAFIPEDVLQKVRNMNDRDQAEFVAAVADNLVYRAVRGLWYRTPMNNVAAMVFDPKQPHLLHAVCMTDANSAPVIAAKSKEGIKQIPEPRPMERPALPPPSPWI